MRQASDLTWYEQLPKIELHLHLEGAIPPGALWELVQKYGGDVSSQEALERQFEYRDFPLTAAGKSRIVVGNISLSLDGRVSGPGGEYDMSWIVPHAITSAARDHMITVTAPATTVLLGKNNYLGFGSYWPGVAEDESADPRDRAFSRWLNSVEKIVFSSSLKDPSWENSRIVNADPTAVVRELREQPGGDIIVLASSSIIRSLLKADALDRLSITLCPEVAGGGARLFEDGLPASSWSLRQSMATESGALCLLYERVRKEG